MPVMDKTEKRYREGSGERYTPGGEVRCHAVAKSKLRRWRELNNDPDITADDVWPECQCEQRAVPGMFACRYHGGMTPGEHKPKSILDIIPVNLGEKYKVLAENPDYISRREDILLMKARKWELLESLQDNAGNEEAWGMVDEALALLRQGEEAKAESLLSEALAQHTNEREVWTEIRESDKVLKDMTNTEVKTAKELRLMATAEQVTALLTNIYNVINRGSEKYIDDPRAQADFLSYIAREIGRFANISPGTIYQLPEP